MALGSQGNRQVKSLYTTLQGEVPLDIDATFAVAANALVGSQTRASFITDPTQPNDTSNSLQVPPDEYWLIFDVYSPVQTPALDGYVLFRVNKKDQNITFGPLSATYKNIFGYQQLQSTLLANPNSDISASLVNTAANGTTVTDVSVHVRVKRIPVGYTGKLTF